MTVLRKHGVWLVVATLAGVVAALLFARSLPERYSSTAQVDVESHVVPGAVPVVPNLATEKIVATSGVVVVHAARALGANSGLLAPHLSAGVSSTSNILSISCSMPTARAAQRCAAAAAAAYVAFRNLAGSSRAARAADPLQATLVTAADLPLAPSGTSRKILLGLGAVLGLLLGAGGIFVREATDGRVRDRADLEDCLGAPAVAAVPRMWRYQANPAFVFATAPLSRQAEAYRYLRVRLGPLLTPAAHPGTVLLVTSPHPREGRTSVAVNLATALTQAGATVLLVDADLRHPALGQLFGAGPAPGLTDLLTQRATLSQAAIPTDVPGLSLVTIGGPALLAAGLFEPTQLARVLADMRGAADAIVIDSAPVLAASAAMTVAQLSDVVIAVADLHRTRRTALRLAADEIKTISQATIVGILNRAPRPLTIGRTTPPAPTTPPGHAALLAIHNATTRAARNGHTPGYHDLPTQRDPTGAHPHATNNDTTASAGNPGSSG
jgi:polysaccharide biosynthesis transport protein